MCDYDIQSDFDVKGLSLIDVSSEDDCLLINSPIHDQINLPFSGSFNEHGTLKEDESRGNGRSNLRKSLSWDSSFFSSAAFLDASTMLDSSRKTREDDSVEPACNDLKKEDPRTVSSSNKLESTNKDKKGARKKLNIAVKDLGKIIKQVSSRPQTSQSVSRSGVSTSSFHNQPKGVSKFGSISTTQTKKASLSCKAAKFVTGRTTMSKTVSSRPTSSRSSLNMISNDSRIAAEGKSPPARSRLSTFAKLNSSMSAASSYSDWSSESSSSPSSTSTAYRRSNTVRASSLADVQQVLDSQDDAEVTGSLAESAGRLNPISITPSGLRPPSPKLAFSNGARLSGHTRNQSVPSYTSAPIALPNFGAKSSDQSCSLNKTPLRNGPRTPKISTGITPKLQNEPAPRIDKVTQRLRALILHRKK